MALTPLAALLIALMAPGGAADLEPRTVVIVSADTEWRIVRGLFPGDAVSPSPYGEWAFHDVATRKGRERVVLFHGGWGKIAAAASAQYAIDLWKPALLVNLGTCGGFEGSLGKGDVLLVDRTVVYDIVEQMGDSAEAIASYTTAIDLTWTKGELPAGVRQGPIASGDRDLFPAEVPRLRNQYGAVAGDWESGSIAWVARKNGVKVLILRGVSDVVGASGSEAYGNPAAFEAGARSVMSRLFDLVPFWLDRLSPGR